jgi:hypothetical protein
MQDLAAGLECAGQTYIRTVDEICNPWLWGWRTQD